jgi:nitric oxide reductase large subunit
MADKSNEVVPLSPWWRHAAILVMIGGFSVLSYVTVLTYTNAPPIPEKAVDAAGNMVFTGADIRTGQEVFFKYALMDHGTLMILLDLFPGGVLQLWDSIANGYWHARRLTFLMGGFYHKLEWVRMAGDMIFILFGAVALALGVLHSMWKRDLAPPA